MITPDLLPPAALAFLAERHHATLVTLRADGSPHAVPVGFGWDHEHRLVRLITFASSVKARHAARGGRAAISQVDGARWLTLEGTIRLATEPDAVAAAVQAFAVRYRTPGERPDRVAVEIAVDRVLGSGRMLGR
jgi:F420H(2)-dependent biliverdin reductase